MASSAASRARALPWMSEMTASRMRYLVGGATLAGLALWILAASYLWRTKVPDALDLPKVRLRDYFTAADLRRADRFERFYLIEFPISAVALLAAMWIFAKKGTGFVRESAAGPIGTGMLLGMLTFGIVWFVQLPFSVAELWWGRRHGVTNAGYEDVILG